MANLGSLSVSLTANASAFNSSLKNAQTALNKFAGDATRSLGVMGVGIGTMIGNLAASAVSAAFGAAIDIGKKVFEMGEGFIKAASSAELLRVQIKVLAGSVKEGAKLFDDLERFAIATSFSFEEVVTQARTLMALKVKKSEVVNTMTLLGTLAMGDAERMRLLGKAYTDTMSKGSLRAQEMNQFAENNVNVMDALMKSMGKTSQQIIKMREDGLITFRDLHNALVSITTGQGQFTGLLEQMLDTTSGKWQQFQERLAKISREFGEKLLPAANSFLDWLDDAMPDIEKLANTLSDATRDMIDSFRYAARIFKKDIAPTVRQMQAAWGFGDGMKAIARLGKAQREFDRRNPPKPKGNAQANGIGQIKPMAPDPPPAPFAGVGGLPGMFSGLLWEEQMRQTEAAFDEIGKTVLATQEPKEVRQRKAASSLERGSQEAFSAIISAMRTTRDPSVAAIHSVASVLRNDVAKPLEIIKNEVKGGGFAFNILTAEKI